jgi:hypothetical protein
LKGLPVILKAVITEIEVLSGNGRVVVRHT